MEFSTEGGGGGHGAMEFHAKSHWVDLYFNLVFADPLQVFHNTNLKKEILGS
jgi:hypothetical protein